MGLIRLEYARNRRFTYERGERFYHNRMGHFLYEPKMGSNRENNREIKKSKNAFWFQNPIDEERKMAGIIYPNKQPIEVTLYDLTCQAIARLALENALQILDATAQPSFSRSGKD